MNRFGQDNFGNSSPSVTAVQTDVPSPGLHELLGDGKPDARAVNLRGEEGVENLLGIRTADTLSTIHDIDMDKTPLVIGDTDFNLGVAISGALHRILEQVLKDRTGTIAVDHNLLALLTGKPNRSVKGLDQRSEELGKTLR